MYLGTIERKEEFKYVNLWYCYYQCRVLWLNKRREWDWIKWVKLWSAWQTLLSKWESNDFRVLAIQIYSYSVNKYANFLLPWVSKIIINFICHEVAEY